MSVWHKVRAFRLGSSGPDPAELGLLIAVVVTGWYLRVSPPGPPGKDVDELVYARIAKNWLDEGFLGTRPEYIDPVPHPYASHPFFMFWAEIAYFFVRGSGVAQARELAVLASLVMIVLVWWVLRSSLGPVAGLLAAGMLAIDGWTVFTNRVGWAENVQIPLGILMLWALAKTVSLDERRQASGRGPAYGAMVLGGLALGGALVYKHVGVVFTEAGILYLLVRRVRWQSLMTVLGTIVLTAAGYVYLMYLWIGGPYLEATYHQLRRVAGLERSRGAIQNTSDVVGALIGNYAIFLTSIFALAAVGALVGWRTLQVLNYGRQWLWFWYRSRSGSSKHRAKPSSQAPLAWRDPMHALVWCWATCTYATFVVARLKLPHYLILLLVPAICYAAVEVKLWIDRGRQRGRPIWRYAVVAVLAAVLVSGNLVAWKSRLHDRRDDAVGQAISWMAANAPANAQVVADEFIGQWLPQPYCQVSHTSRCTKPDYVIAYTTRTQKLPDNQTLTRLITQGELVATFTGFKEVIKIYAVPSS